MRNYYTGGDHKEECDQEEKQEIELIPTEREITLVQPAATRERRIYERRESVQDLKKTDVVAQRSAGESSNYPIYFWYVTTSWR